MMDELISRREALRAFESYDGSALDKLTMKEYDDLEMTIWSVPGFELIRCRECKHYQTHISCVGGEYDGCDVWLDNGNEIEVKPDDFCSYAERRVENDG